MILSYKGRSSVPAGFTLIELLVVIAIIAILASMLLPAIAKGKQQAQKAVCLSNERQVMQTWALYHTDFNGALPGNYYYQAGSPPSWVFGTVHGPTPGFIATNSFTDPSKALFANYLKAHQVYLCPAEHTSYKVKNQTLQKMRTYSMNDSMNGNLAPIHLYKRVEDIRLPSSMFVLIETEPWSNCWTPFLIPREDQNFFHVPGALHSKNSADITFSDGHSETHRWKTPLVRPNPEGSPHDYITSMPKDEEWIRTHAHHLLVKQ